MENAHALSNKSILTSTELAHMPSYSIVWLAIPLVNQWDGQPDYIQHGYTNWNSKKILALFLLYKVGKALNLNCELDEATELEPFLA